MIDRLSFGRTTALALKAAIALSFLASAPAIAESWRVVNIEPEGRLHLRQDATSRSRVIAYIPGDARGLQSSRCSSNWCQIEFRGLTGWVYRRYLAPDKASDKLESGEDLVANLTIEINIAELSNAKRLSVFNPAGNPLPVYSQPDESRPIAGRLGEGVTNVEGLGACVRGWCYIRSGPLIGWLPALLLAPSPADQKDDETTASIVAEIDKPNTNKDKNALNETINTATTASVNPQERGPLLSPAGNKYYSLAGLAGRRSLTIHAEADEKSRPIGAISRDATRIEGLRKCVRKWCLVRWNDVDGWVERRHLADPEVEDTQLFAVTGLPLLTPLDVVDRPGAAANVVGKIPSYATGIVPIGGCDKTWCHVRYLGVAGWVSGDKLKPEQR